MIQANYEFEIQLQEVRKLKERVRELEENVSNKFYEIQSLQENLASKTEECTHLMESNNDYLMKIAKHRKTGIPYCNKTMECLSVRLKMPQFTCLTLQPLFEACLEVEIIIAGKAKKKFYEEI